MLILTPLAPDEAYDVTVHIVLNDFSALGRAYVETDEAEADEATIVEDILSGQYSRPLRVWWPSIPPKAGRVMSPRTLRLP
jgi:hypothetical protein